MARYDFIAYGVEHFIVHSVFMWDDDTQPYPSASNTYDVRYNSGTQRYEYSYQTTIAFQSPKTYASNTPANLKDALTTEWQPVSTSVWGTWNTVKWVTNVNYCYTWGAGNIDSVNWMHNNLGLLTWSQVQALPKVVLSAEMTAFVTIPSTVTTISCLRMRVREASPFGIGGNFNVTINGDIVNASTTYALPAIAFPGTYTSKLTINCPAGSGIYSGVPNNSRVMTFNKTGTLEINGNIYSTYSTSTGHYPLVINSGTAIINGNIYGGSSSGLYQTGGAVTITGNLYGSKTTNSANGMYKTGGQTTIYGNIYGGGSPLLNVCRGIHDIYGNTTINGSVYGAVNGGMLSDGLHVANTASAQVTINGSVYGGNNVGCYGASVYAANSINIFINGDVKGGVGLYADGLHIASSVAKVYVNGDIYANKTSANVLVHGINNTQAAGRHFHKYLGRYFDRNGNEELAGGKPSPTEAINSLSGIGYGWLITGEVDSGADLNAIRTANLVYGNFVQTADITFTGNVSPVLTNFAGTYNGYDYKSKTAYFLTSFANDGDASGFGFFSNLTATGVLRHMQFAMPQVTSGVNRAVLVGGTCNGTVEYCFARGGTVPALVANIGATGVLKQCYSTTKLCLSNAGGSIQSCYHNTVGDTNGTYIANMQDADLYVGWNFKTTWGIDPLINGGYPYLVMAPIMIGMGGNLIGGSNMRGAASVLGRGDFVGIGLR